MNSGPLGEKNPRACGADSRRGVSRRCRCAGGVLWRLPIGTVYMRINPEVSMEVNRLDRVVSLEGENNDGAELIAGFSYYGRTVDEVTDDLAELAEDEGYLDEGGTSR